MRVSTPFNFNLKALCLAKVPSCWVLKVELFSKDLASSTTCGPLPVSGGPSQGQQQMGLGQVGLLHTGQTQGTQLHLCPGSL